MKLYKKFEHAFRGLRHAWRADLSFKVEVWGAFVYLAFILIFWPLQAWELVALVSSYFLILIVELVNTSIETALERLHPESHELIGRSKDIAASAVLLSICLSIIIAVTIIRNHIN